MFAPTCFGLHKPSSGSYSLRFARVAIWTPIYKSLLRYSVLWLHILLTYLLTPWCRVLLEKLTGLQPVKKFPAFHGTPRFITTLTSVRHLSLSWASPIQSTYPHLTSWRSILILSTHLRLGLPSGLLPSGFPTKTLYTPSPHPYAPHAQPIILLDEICSHNTEYLNNDLYLGIHIVTLAKRRLYLPDDGLCKSKYVGANITVLTV